MKKRKLRRKWHQTRAPQDKTNLNNAAQQLKREIQKIKEESISVYLSELTDDKITPTTHCGKQPEALKDRSFNRL